MVLEEKINKINRLIDIDKYIKDDNYTIKNIEKYYKINDLFYRKFHSNKGFMHFRITKGDKVLDDDILYQDNIIAKYIKNGDKVLELGSGQGANIKYLANKYPDSSFIGIDLYPLKLKKDDPKNIKLYKQDYSNLPFISDESIDIIYGIETIVHSPNKKSVFDEIYRILKKDGILILYDYTLTKDYNNLDDYEKEAIEIISKGGAASLVESLDSWNKYIKDAGFKTIKYTDLHEYLLPDLKRLEHKANHIMKKDSRVKFFFKVFPKSFVNNILLGWLGYDAYNEGLGYYSEWILKK